MVKIQDGFVSVNALYSAKLSYSGGRPHAQMYKNPKAAKIENIVRNQLKAVDFSDYIDFLRTTKSFNFTLQLVAKSNIGRKDTSNYIKNIEDIWTRFVKEDLGIDTYDDRLHTEVHAFKSIIPKADEELALLCISESHFNTRFDIIEKPEKVFFDGTSIDKDLVKELKRRKVKFFNQEEDRAKCNTHLHIITPETRGIFDVAKCINSAYQHLDHGFCFVGIVKEGWDESYIESFQATIDLINNLGGSNIKAKFIEKPLDMLEYFD